MVLRKTFISNRTSTYKGSTIRTHRECSAMEFYKQSFAKVTASLGKEKAKAKVLMYQGLLKQFDTACLKNCRLLRTYESLEDQAEPKNVKIDSDVWIH